MVQKFVVEKSGFEKFMVEKSGVEKFGVEMSFNQFSFLSKIHQGAFFKSGLNQIIFDLRRKNALPFRSNIACTVKSILSQKVHRSYLIVHLLIRIVTEYASNKKVTSSTDLDIGLK